MQHALSKEEMSRQLGLVENASLPPAWLPDTVGQEIIGLVLKVSTSLPSDEFPKPYKIVEIETDEVTDKGETVTKVYSFHGYHASIRREFGENADNWVGSVLGIKYKGVNSKKANRPYKEFTSKLFT